MHSFNEKCLQFLQQFYFRIYLIGLLKCGLMSFESNNKMVLISFLFYLSFFQKFFFYISFILYWTKTQIPDKWKLKSKTVPYHRCFGKHCYEIHPMLKIRKISQKKINGFSQKNQVVLQLDAQRMLINIKLQSGIVSSRVLQCVLALIPILLKI